MRRKISLYIGNQLVDLDDQSFILFNYTMDDLSNPTIVKNSFSQQITLKGTPANNKVFGECFRADRRIANYGTQAGVDFNASKKTPFAIYNELGEILESGYVKLDSISRNGADIQYKVTLYGGLGSFIYALSYDENGNKRSLADLDYMGNGDPAELDFVITKTAIQRAWEDLQSLYSGGTPTGKWTIINFAPAYNGLPNDFSPDKGLLHLPGAGLPATLNGYTTKNGYGLVNLANPQDEWAVKDLRSYLQRPVLRIKAFWDAICNPENNGGYSVDISDIDQLYEPAYGTWLTLPTIPSLGTAKQSSEGLYISVSPVTSTGNNLGRYDVNGSVPSGAMVSAVLRCKLRFNMPSGADSYNSLSFGAIDSSRMRGSVVFLQVVAYSSDNTIVGGSAVKVLGAGSFGAGGIASACDFHPPFNTDNFEGVSATTLSKYTNGVFEFADELSFSVDASDVSYYVLMAYAYTREGTRGRWGEMSYVYSGDGSTSRATFYHDYATPFQANSATFVDGGGNTITREDSGTLRSGATITKQMLLSTSGTPADYLLSLCKVFGLYFVTNEAEKKITILKRNSLYQDETIDLTGRVDLSKEVSINPLVFDKKWYDFFLEDVGGAFSDEYKNSEGIPYGIQRVDTGYDFNADSINLMDSVVFKNAVTVLSRSRYWNIIVNGADFIPSPFLDNGNTITRWNASDETQDTPIPCPPSSATITYYNNLHNGYDIRLAPKVQFADADGKMVDGKDVLLILDRFETYNSFKITDDLPVMSVVNGGKPCWILDEGEGVYVPIFSRYEILTRQGRMGINVSLDFGIPRQLDIPNIHYREDSTIYQKYWKSYLSDRYDANTKVMTCRVDFSGIRVSQDLLRKFYWYDNSLWVLNAIRNYSLTTFDPVECEFVQVQDKDNYLIGQD